ncbi:MAG: ATP-binding cassette domain-containing protein [Gemmatimonadota bacterium]
MSRVAPPAAERRRPVFGLEGLRVRAPDGRIVLEGVNLRAYAGERIGIIGPNGAGKTTLLRTIADSVLGSGRRTAVVWETCPFAEALSGRENLERSLELGGCPRSRVRERSARALTAFDLRDAADDAVWEYSFGMRRRLALAEAMGREADVVLLDEPTIGLDPTGRERLKREVRGSLPVGGVLLLASNDPGFVADTCGRVLLLRRGRVAAEGTPEGLVAGIRAATIIEVQGRAPDGQPPAGLRLVGSERGRLRFAAPRGSADLPALCEWLVVAGCAPRAVTVHEPDLADVYFHVTGERLVRTGSSGAEA